MDKDEEDAWHNILTSILELEEEQESWKESRKERLSLDYKTHD